MRTRVVAIEWVEMVDDIVPVPTGMPVRAPVRRRRWRTGLDPDTHRRFELAVYIGLDEDSMAWIRWECDVWEQGLRLDHMRSGCLPLTYAPVTSTDRLMWPLTPRDVIRFAVWGGVLMGAQSRR